MKTMQNFFIQTGDAFIKACISSRNEKNNRRSVKVKLLDSSSRSSGSCCRRRWIPKGRMMPFSASRERSYLARAVHQLTGIEQRFNILLFRVLTGTKWKPGRHAISQIARTSFASFFWLLTNTFTCCACYTE